MHFEEDHGEGAMAPEGKGWSAGDLAREGLANASELAPGIFTLNYSAVPTCYVALAG